MWLYGVVKINKPYQARLSLLAARKAFLIMPHVHQGPNHPLGLAVGLWPVDTGKFLADVMDFTGVDKFVTVRAPVFLAIV